MSEESALTFPCEFSIKVMGINSDSFEHELFVIANQHVPNLGENRDPLHAEPHEQNTSL